MADLGTKTTVFSPSIYHTLNITQKNTFIFNPEDHRYKIEGVVEVSNVPTGYLLVRLYKKSSGELISQTTSLSDGSFIFNNIANITSGYFIVAFDSTTSPIYNAVIFDRITSVPME